MQTRRHHRQSHPPPTHQPSTNPPSTPATRSFLPTPVRRRRPSLPSPDAEHVPTYRTLAPKPHSKPYMDVSVADFVTLPHAGNRHASARHSIGPVDVTVRPPSYNLVMRNSSPEQHPSSNPSPTLSSPSNPLLEMAPQKVFLIHDHQHVDRLVSIVNSRRNSLPVDACSTKVCQRDDPDRVVSECFPKVLTDCCRDDDSQEDCLSDQLEDANDLSHNHLCVSAQNDYGECSKVDKADEEDDFDLSHSINVSSTPDVSSSQLAKIFYTHPDSALDSLDDDHVPSDSVLFPSLQHDSFSDLRVPSDDDLLYQSSTTNISSSCQPDDASEVSSIISTSSFASSLAEIFSVPTSNSFDTQSLNYPALRTTHLPQSYHLSTKDKQTQTSPTPTTYVAVKDTDTIANQRRRAGLNSLLQKNAPAPVKYTFRPLHKATTTTTTATTTHSSTDDTFTDETPSILSSECPRRPSEDSTKSIPSSSKTIEPPTLTAVRTVVDKIDPRTAIGITNAAPSGLGIFRRMTVMKRLSDESNDSVTTQYYEDDYTKFIEKKTSSYKLKGPLSKMITPEAWSIRSSFSSRSDARSASPLSISTSDEFYNPTASGVSGNTQSS